MHPFVYRVQITAHARIISQARVWVFCATKACRCRLVVAVEGNAVYQIF